MQMCLLLFSAKATYAAIQRTYSYLTPDLWKENVLDKTPYQQHWEFISKQAATFGRIAN
jgi:small subunit ribosomal protein S2e